MKRGARRRESGLSAYGLSADGPGARPRPVGRLAVALSARATAEALERRQFLSSTPIISEFLAQNNNGIADENGDRGDWIEIHNPAAADLNLNGYFLTDSSGNLNKWAFPNVTLPSGGYLTVFADGKNRAVAGAPLHTNFSLTTDPGYVALVAPNGATVLSSYDYPQQIADKSYGVQVTQSVTRFIGPSATARALVPQNGGLGSTWTAFDYDDTAWLPGLTGVGYETATPVPSASGWLVRMVDTVNGSLATIADATSVLNGNSAAAIASDTSVNRPVLNFGGGMAFAGDLNYPNGVLPGSNMSDPGREQIAIRASALVTIPAGTYTIDVNSDDGFRLRIPGVTFTRRTNEEFSGTANPSPNDTLVYGAGRGSSHTFGTFTVPAAGLTTTVQLDYFEGGSGDGLEVSVASGDQTAFIGAGSTFVLLGDGAKGWSVRQPVTNGFNVKMVDVDGGTDGSISNISEATAVLNQAASGGAFTFTTSTAIRPSVNFGFGTSPTGGGSFANDWLLPNDNTTSASNVSPGREQYALRALANVNIPAGTWTINVGSDEGFRLTIPGVTFTNRNGEEFTGAASPSPADTIVYGGQRSAGGNTFASFTVPVGGLSTTLQLDYYERLGTDAVELSIAPGVQGTFANANFTLLADNALGWRVFDPMSVPVANYASSIGLNLLGSMRNVNATAYVRAPFSAGAAGDYDSVRLKMKYDDGFVAYLNGQLLTSRNAPAAPAFDSAATASRNDADALAYESIAVNPSLLRVGSNVLAVQGLNDSASGDDFLIYPELEGIRTTLSTPGYLTATPGAANGATADIEIVKPVTFSHQRGFYNAPFQLTLATATPGAQIVFTTNGTVPALNNGTTYLGSPITINKTTTLRVAAFKTGALASDVETETYIFTADVIQQSPNGAAPLGFPSTWGSNTVDYGMDPDVATNTSSPYYTNTVQNALKSLRTISIVMNVNDMFGAANGIYANPGGDERTWERPTSVEVINPDGSPGYQANAGIRIRGGFSRSTDNPKHGFRLFFRSEYGDSKFDYPIMGPGGADEFDKFDLRTFNNYSWSFQGDPAFTGLRDQFSRDTQLAMGENAERGDYVHLYINGQYWGIYNTDERADANYGESYYGGTDQDYDVVKVDPDLGYNIEATDGNMNAWNAMVAMARGDVTNEANYQKLLGNNPDGTRNPAYPVYVDVDNLINYMLVIYYGGNLDAPISNFLGNTSPNNFFAMRNRTTNDQGWQFFAHDSEHTLLTGDLNNNRTGPWSDAGWATSKTNPQWLFERLINNATFKLRFADLVHKNFTNGGALTPSAVATRLGVRISQMGAAVTAESARWGDSKRPTAPFTKNDWQAEVNRLLNNWVPQRTNIVLQQFRAKGWYTSLTGPSFTPQRGGVVNAGFNLSISNPNGFGTIWYTNDGSDPRMPDGSVRPGAIQYTGSFPINSTRTVTARVLSGANWSAAESALFSYDAGLLRVSEIMYGPPALPATGFAQQDHEYVEIVNAGAGNLDLSGVTISDGITYSFPATNAPILAPGARMVIVKNLAAFQARYPGVPAAQIAPGVFTGSLSNEADHLLIKGAVGQTLLDFTYDGTWYPQADNAGYSIVATDLAAAAAAWNKKSNWRPSSGLLGGPGLVDPGTNAGAVVINEIVTNTSDPNGDWVELLNTTNAPVDISGWFFSDDATDLKKYQFPAGTVIAAGGYKVLSREQDFGRAGLPGVNTPFGLSKLGEKIYLTGNNGAGDVGGYRESASFSATEPEKSVGRVTGADGRTDFWHLTSATRGAVNTGPVIGPVVINEVMYNPAPVSGTVPNGGKAEFIELRNITNAPVPLYDPANPANVWKFTNGVEFSFPANTSIPANGFVVVSPVDPATFRAQYNLADGVLVFGPYTGALDNGGERVTVSRPGAPLPEGVPYIDVDTLTYDDVAPWPLSPDGNGPSIAREGGTGYGNDATNWTAEVVHGSPGRENLDVVAPTSTAIAFDWTRSPNRILVTFSEDVSTTLTAASLPVVRRGTNGGADVPVSFVLQGYDLATNVATFVPASGNVLPDGNYRATLNPGNVKDRSGNVLAFGRTLDFFSLMGDANHNRSVGADDFNLLATNFGLSGMNWAEGDFDYDGTVGPGDFNILATRFGTTVPAPASLTAELPPASEPTIVAAPVAAAPAPVATPAPTPTPTTKGTTGKTTTRVVPTRPTPTATKLTASAAAAKAKAKPSVASQVLK